MKFIIRNKDKIIGCKIREGTIINYKEYICILTKILDSINRRSETILVHLDKMVSNKNYILQIDNKLIKSKFEILDDNIINQYIKDYFYVIVDENVYDLKDKLKEEGAKFDWIRKTWSFEKDNQNYIKYATEKVYIINGDIIY